MRIHNLTAAAVSFTFAVLTALCAQSLPESDGTRPAVETEPTGEALQPAYEDTFHFVVEVKDDGEGKAGGWQKAVTTLKFGDWRHPFAPYFWQCPIYVGMPIRTERQGRIPAERAAQITAEIATVVARDVMHSRESWNGLSALYCDRLRTGMERMFKAPPYRIDARVRMP